MTLRAAVVCLALLVMSPPAFADDCFVHPATLIALEVISCAPLDAANASHVVKGARMGTPMTKALEKEIGKLVAKHSAVVLHVKTRRTRTIQIDSPQGVLKEPQAADWLPQVDDRWLVLRTTEAGVCQGFPPQKSAVLSHPTDCSCDSGPHGWCALDESAMVTAVPAALAKFSN